MTYANLFMILKNQLDKCKYKHFDVCSNNDFAILVVYDYFIFITALKY